MTRIKVTKEFQYEGKTYTPGETADFPEAIADRIQEKGAGTQVLDEEGIEVKSAETGQAGGVNVEDMLPGGNFIGVDDVTEGDAVKVAGSGYVDDSFDQDRLVLPVLFQDEDKQVSLGPENIKRIAEGYGMNTQNWVGKAIKVDSIEKYPGLDKKGIVWKPVTEG